MSLRRRDLLMYEPIIHQLSRKQAPLHSLNKGTVVFIIKCLSCIIHDKSRFRLSSSQRERVKTLMYPYKKDYTQLANLNNISRIHNSIQKQHGRGVFLSGLITAAIPLISSLLKKILKK